MPAVILSELEKSLLELAADSDDGIVAPDDRKALELTGGDVFLSRSTCKALKKRRMLDMLGSTGCFKITIDGRSALDPGGNY